MGSRLDDLIKDNIFVLATGLLLGLGVANIAFAVLPVVAMQGEIVQRDPSGVTLHVWGKKLRECKFLEITGYASRNGVLFDAYATRTDKPVDGKSKPLGEIDIGLWRIAPITGADKALMFVTHSCKDDSIRITKIAEVTL